MREAKHFIVEQMTLVSLIPALYYSFRRYEVRYYKISSFMMRFSFLLSILKFNRIQMNELSGVDFGCFTRCISDLSLSCYKANKLDEYSSFFKKYVGNGRLTEAQLRVLTLDCFKNFLNKHRNFIYFCQKHLPEESVVYSYILKSLRKKYKVDPCANQAVRVIAAPKNIIPMLEKVVSVLCRMIIAKLRKMLGTKVGESVKEQSHVNSDSAVQSIEIAFFPHQGVSYGNLFKKDVIYSSGLDARLAPENILHIEHSLCSMTSSIISEYKASKIPYVLLSFSHLAALKIAFAASMQALSMLFVSFFVWKLMLILNYKIYGYYLPMRSFEQLRVAYVGYDILFPCALSAALSLLDIRTVAMQERPMTTYINNAQIMMFDYYFVSDLASRKHILNLKLGDYNRIDVAGLPRIDLMREKYKQRIELRKKLMNELPAVCERIVVCFDYHSDEDSVQADNPFVNWKNNRIFYQDIIRLAKLHKDVCFIIRGKDDRWVSLEAFNDLYEQIVSIDNVIVDRVYDVLHRSYDLAAASDLVIAKHTSIAEECDHVGIPVIFHDYAENHEAMFSRLNLDAKPAKFVHCFSELSHRLSDALAIDKVDLGGATKVSEEPCRKFLVKEKIQQQILACVG